MNALNNPGCVTAVSNTGLPDCPLTPGPIVGAILIDKGQIFEAGDILTTATFKTKLQGLTMIEGKMRAYPIFRFQGITDNSEEATMASMGYGSSIFVRDGKYNWRFNITAGGLCLHKNLRSFNKTNKRVLFVDDADVIYGTMTADGFTGFTLDSIYVPPFKISDGSNVSMFEIEFKLAKPAELNENISYIKMPDDVETSFKGITDVLLTEVENVALNVTIAAKTSCDAINLYDTYEDEIAALPIWVVKKAGVPVTPSAVVKVPGVKGWKLTFEAATVGEHTITLADPVALNTAGIGGAPANGFEAIPITVTVTAT